MNYNDDQMMKTSEYAAPIWYGAPETYQNDAEKGGLQLHKRRVLHLKPILYSLFIPCFIFAGVSAILTLEIHSDRPITTWLVALLVLAFVLLLGVIAAQNRSTQSPREPSWLYFVFLTALLAFVLAVGQSTYNFQNNLSPYYDRRDLASYLDINPSLTSGSQIMDAGMVLFSKGSTVDLTKWSSFRQSGIYCVAPISFAANVTLSTYDFWAVGKECCSGYAADFRCGDVYDTKAQGGLRVISDTDRALYRLAVQRAEASYNIRAMHPIFFEWETDAPSKVQSWKDTGMQNYYLGIIAHGALQCILVVVGAITFSKLT